MTFLTTKKYIPVEEQGDGSLTVDDKVLFSEPVSGQDPILDNHLALKSYVDTEVASVSGGGGGDFGNNWTEWISAGLTTSTSDDWVDKVTLTEGSGIPSGTYRLSWYVEIYNSQNGKGIRSRFYNVTDDMEYANVQMQQNGVSSREHFSGWANVFFDGTDKTIKLQYSRVSSPGSGNAQNARVDMWRVD